MGDPQDAPDIVLFPPRYHVARKRHVCSRCGGPIRTHEKYQVVSYTEDGVFVSRKEHFRADAYPSGCPYFAEREKAELAEQFERDAALFPVCS